MASPTSDEILEIFEELNYPSANKLRAALIKRGVKARLKDVEAFVKSQTPTQLFAKAPKYQGKIVATRPNERWVIDSIDPTAKPSQDFKYIFDSRHLPEKIVGQGNARPRQRRLH